MNVFVSYTVRDGLVDQAYLRNLAHELSDRCEPYVDLLAHRCGGHQASVHRALQQADAVLLCLSPAIFTSPWVALEMQVAKRLGLPILRWPAGGERQENESLAALLTQLRQRSIVPGCTASRPARTTA